MEQSDQIEGGFNFQNFNRNSSLKAKGIAEPKAISTGTTICALTYKVL